MMMIQLNYSNRQQLYKRRKLEVVHLLLVQQEQLQLNQLLLQQMMMKKVRRCQLHNNRIRLLQELHI